MDKSLFQQLLNKVGRGYGQIDKNIFGGLLPGGAATPIGAALQNWTPPKGIEPIPASTRRLGSVLDATAGAIAGAQPLVERTIKASPDPVQGVIASGLNALPFSVNLFGRYYTGLGDRNLQIPESATKGIKEILDASVVNTGKRIKETQSFINNYSSMLKDAKAGKLLVPPGAPSGALPLSSQMLNDMLAEEKSKLNRIKQGDIPFDAYATTDTNPLTSPATSLGMLWFSPEKEGYAAKEKYDFAYGAADAKEPAGPNLGPDITPSQNLILGQMLTGIPGVQRPVGANFNQITDFGRAVVSKMPDKSFEYLINIR